MAMEFNSVGFDDLLDDPIQEEPVQEPTQTEEEPLIPDQPSDDTTPADPGNPNEPPAGTEDDVLTAFLKSYNIEDTSKIKFEGEDGTIEEVDFNSLSKEDQLNMLKDLASSDVSDYEREVIQWMRNTGMDMQQIVNYYSQKAIEDYLKENPDKAHQKSYKVDDYTDDEIYISDLKVKYPDLTDEELQSELENAKINEDLFKRKIEALRKFYKEEEEHQEEEVRQQEQQQYEALRDSLLDAANRFTEVKLDSTDPESVAFEIEDDDRNDIFNYLLSQDKDGLSQFDKDLSNPAALIELAYLRTKGRLLVDETSKYWKNQLVETRKELANVKKELEKITKKNDTNVVTPPKTSKAKPKSVSDL